MYDMESYCITPDTKRYFCKTCGTPMIGVYTRPEPIGVYALVPVSLFRGHYQFTPACHIWCSQAGSPEMLNAVNDGLPKYKDLPVELGGSGETQA